MQVLAIIGGVVAVGVLSVLLVLAVKIVKQWERGVVLRLGKVTGVRQPGLRLIIPIIDRMTKVDTRIITYVLEPQEVITRDNVTIKVNAVVYFKVDNPISAVIAVANYVGATVQIALTTLRSVLGQSELDEVLAHRDEINKKLQHIIDEQTEEPWGVKVTVAEVKDVLLPETMQRAMARQAEAERERRAKVVHAEGEHQAAKALGMAADVISAHPVALQLRYLQTMVEMASERSSTIIPIPLDIFDIFRSLRDRGNGAVAPRLESREYEESAVGRD
ncbi:MAG: slipin family protein [Chloroflexi bacterium]|nr:slipin family protein [Chloroflexota bacterium]